MYKQGGRVDATPPPPHTHTHSLWGFSEFFPRLLNISTWRLQYLFVYPPGVFWNKFSIDQLLWLWDMMSQAPGGQAIFEWKWMFFQLLSTIKENLVDKTNEASTYLCDILHVKHKKIPIFTLFTCFLVLGKIQDGGQDGDHVWWCYRSPAAPPPITYIFTSSCREDQRLSTEGKILFEILQHIRNSREGSHHPPPPFCTMVWVWLSMYVQGLIT